MMAEKKEIGKSDRIKEGYKYPKRDQSKPPSEREGPKQSGKK